MNRLDEETVNRLDRRGLLTRTEYLGFHEVHVPATAMYLTRPHWLDFYAAVFGLDGLIRRVFPDKISRQRFEATRLYADLFVMLLELRGSDDRETPLPAGTEGRVLTIRVPAAVHEALKVEAHEVRMSLNKLCQSKILQPFGATSLLASVRRCRVCGCTDDRACEGGCYWLEADLCSRCAGPPAA